MAENGSFQVVYGSTLKAWNPRFYTFMMAGKVSKSADNYAQQVHCAKQTSSKICVVCTCLSQFDFCKPVLPCLECTPLLQTVLYFFCALWVSKFTWFQHWEKEILRIMFLLLGNDARLGEDAHGALPVEPWCYGWPGKATRFEMIMFNFKDSECVCPCQ